MLCSDCLNLFRSEYVEDALEDEKGDAAYVSRAIERAADLTRE